MGEDRNVRSIEVFVKSRDVPTSEKSGSLPGRYPTLISYRRKPSTCTHYVFKNVVITVMTSINKCFIQCSIDVLFIHCISTSERVKTGKKLKLKMFYLRHAADLPWWIQFKFKLHAFIVLISTFPARLLVRLPWILINDLLIEMFGWLDDWASQFTGRS